MKGARPPSSKEHFLIVEEAWPMRRRPTPVEPVKEILRTVGLVQSSRPTSLLKLLVVMTLMTPCKSLLKCVGD